MEIGKMEALGEEAGWKEWMKGDKRWNRLERGLASAGFGFCWLPISSLAC